jgi:hypothetical protein
MHRLLVLVKLFKTFDLLFGFVLRDAVGLLDLARQLIAVSGNHVEVIVGEFAPLCFHLALELLPVAFNDIPVHIKVFCQGIDWRYCYEFSGETDSVFVEHTSDSERHEIEAISMSYATAEKYFSS